MQPWPDLLHLGDLDFTVPAAVALGAALLACRAHYAALRWGVLFACGMLVVGLSKISFMAWGVGVEALAFKAISGHAAGASAVLPFLFYVSALVLRANSRQRPQPGLPVRRELKLTLRRHAGRLRATQATPAAPATPAIQALRQASMAAGLALGVIVAAQLVLRCEHTMSEALAGCVVGVMVSASAVAGTEASIGLRRGRFAICFGAVFLVVAWLMDSLHIAYWMIKAARLLASGQPLHSLAID